VLYLFQRKKEADMATVETMLERLAAGPKPFVVVLRYDDGTVQEVAQPRRNQAENIADRYRGSEGMQFQLRNADLTTRHANLISVEVEVRP
jgi:hypothetical protein